MTHRGLGCQPDDRVGDIGHGASVLESFDPTGARNELGVDGDNLTIENFTPAERYSSLAVGERDHRVLAGCGGPTPTGVDFDEAALITCPRPRDHPLRRQLAARSPRRR